MWTILLTFALWSGGSTRTATAVTTTMVGTYSSAAICEDIAKKIIKPQDNSSFYSSKTAQCIQIKA